MQKMVKMTTKEFISFYMIKYIYLFMIQNQWSRFLSFVAETLCLSSCRMYEEIHGSELTTQARQKSQSKGRVGEEKGKLQLYSTLTLKTSRAKQCWSTDFMQRVPVLKIIVKIVKCDMEHVEWRSDYLCYSIRSLNGHHVLEIIHAKTLLSYNFPQQLAP